MIEIKVDKTDEDELMIHKSDGNGGWINIIIDEDGDIELMHIKSNRNKSYNRLNVSLDEVIEFWNSH